MARRPVVQRRRGRVQALRAAAALTQLEQARGRERGGGEEARGGAEGDDGAVHQRLVRHHGTDVCARLLERVG